MTVIPRVRPTTRPTMRAALSVVVLSPVEAKLADVTVEEPIVVPEGMLERRLVTVLLETEASVGVIVPVTMAEPVTIFEIVMISLLLESSKVNFDITKV